MGDTVTASPPEDDPIVTPTPPIYVQFAERIRRVPMRPTMNPDTGNDMTPEEQRVYRDETYPRLVREWTAAGSPKASKPRNITKDSWGASGCHPTTMAMQLAWLMTSPQTSADLVLRNRGGETLPSDIVAPLWIAKWLWDSTGNPDVEVYPSKSPQHPPWVPKANGGKEWNVDHAALWESAAMSEESGEKFTTAKKEPLVTFKGQPLVLHHLKMGDIGKGKPAAERRRLKKAALKKALLRCGPLALNMTFPGHFVLLYGYRGRHMYIIDPGKELFRVWGLSSNRKLDPDPKWKEAGKPCQDHIFAVLAPLDDYAANVVIDAEHVFKVSADGDYTGAFLDAVINAEGYLLPGIASFDEFQTAIAPDGRVAGGVLPAPYKPGTTPMGPPAPPPGGGSTSPPADRPPPAPPVPPAPPLPEPSSPAGGITSWAEDIWEKLFGKKPAAAARAVVTVSDAHSGKSLSGVEVEVTGLQMGQTGADGVWHSPDFLPGSYDLKARCKGFGPKGQGGAASAEGEYSQHQAGFQSGDNKFTVELVDVRSASAVVTVREATSHKPLEGVEVEIWSIATGSTNADGVYTSPTFEPGKSYDIKARKEGFGPEATGGAAAKEGEVSKSQVQFAGGERAIVLLMSEVHPATPPAPDGLEKKSDKLAIVSSVKTVDLDALSKEGGTAKFEYTGASWAVTTNWAAYDPAGQEVETETDIVGHTFELTAKALEAHRGKVGYAAYGTWTVRCSRDDYYDDWTFVLRSAMPPIPADPPPAPPKPKPSVPPPAPKPSGKPAPAASTPPCHLGDALTVGGWENYLTSTVPLEVLTQIKGIRDQLPHDKRLTKTKPYDAKKRAAANCWSLLDMGSDAMVAEFKTKFLEPRDVKMREAEAKMRAEPTDANREAYRVARIDRMMTGTYIALIRREGAPASLNTYDSAILTFGTGFAWAKGKGGLPGLFGLSQKENPKLRNFFHNCGFHYGDDGLLVVDVKSGSILSGDAGAEHFCDPAQSDSSVRGSDVQLLDMLVQAARDPDMRDGVWEANITQFKKLHTPMKNLHLIATQGVFSMIVHLHHWGPALVPSPIAYAAAHDDKIKLEEDPSALRDARLALGAIRQSYRGTWHPKFKQAKQYWQHMIADTTADGTPVPLDTLEGADAFLFQAGFKEGSTEAKAIPTDHKKLTQDGIVFDLGPASNYPET